MPTQAKSTDRPLSIARRRATCLGPAFSPPVREGVIATWFRPLAGSLAVLAVWTGLATAQPAPPPPALPAPAAPAPDAGSQAGPARVKPGTETPAIILDGTMADTLLGKPVTGVSGEDMGRLVDVIVDRSGVIRAAIVDFGGFLGVGTRKIAVDWRVLHFSKGGSMETISADLSRDQLRAAPVFKPGEAVVIVGRADSLAPAAAAAVPATVDATARPAPAPPSSSPPSSSPPSSSPPAAPPAPVEQGEQKPQPR